MIGRQKNNTKIAEIKVWGRWLNTKLFKHTFDPNDISEGCCNTALFNFSTTSRYNLIEDYHMTPYKKNLRRSLWHSKDMK